MLRRSLQTLASFGGKTMGTVIFAAMFFLAACGSSAGPSPASSTSQPPASPPGVSSISPTSGPTSGGTTVTITGTNFQKGATVTFGGVAATSVTFASSTKLTATSPKGNAGTVAVVTTNPDGQTGTLSAGFTYTDSGSGGGGGGLSGSPGATATQYVLTYTASTNKMCTIEVSQNQSFTPLVHAVDPSIFPGSDSDGQTNIGQRTFVVGERTIAAETDTAPSITVGAGNATRAPLKYDSYTTGAVTVAYSGQPFVAGDNIIVSGMSDSSFDSIWARVMSASANSFTYWTPATAAGSSGGGTITRSDHFSLALENNTTYYYRIGGSSNTCGASPATGTFTTMDWPNGDTFAENFPTDSKGHWITPTVPESHAATNTLIDPLTGTLVRPLSLFSDWPSGRLYPIVDTCTLTVDSNGFIHCYYFFGGGSALYGINESTGEIRFLGNMVVSPSAGTGCASGAAPAQGLPGDWDPSDANVFYGECNASSGKIVVWKATYTGNDVAVTGNVWISATATTLTTDLGAQLLSFDPSYNETLYHGAGNFFVSGHYLMGYLERWQQGSPAWVVEYDLSTDTIAGAMNTWGNQIAADCSGALPVPCTGGSPLRWTGLHNQGQINGTGQGWTGFSPAELHSGASTMGNFQITLNQTAGLNATDSTDTITVTSTMAGSCGGLTGDPASQDVPPDGCNFLDQLEPGDILQFQDTGKEYVEVTARLSATSITIARGCHFPQPNFVRTCDGTGEVTHADGAILYTINLSYRDPNASWFEWNFVKDPHGQDTSDTNLVWDTVFMASHHNADPPCAVAEAWGIKCSATWDSAFWHKAADFRIGSILTFDGTDLSCPGNACQSYPDFYFPLNPNESPSWAWDSHAYQGGPYVTDSSSTVSSGSGYYILKYSFGSSHPPMNTALPYFSMSGQNQLVDISGPGATLPADSSGNYEFCVAGQAGDCWPGSAAGDVYANLPYPTTQCKDYESTFATGDWCVLNFPDMANGAVQIGTTMANQVGTSNGVPVSGMGKSRNLLMGLYNPPRMVLSSLSAFPDESWVAYPSCIADPYIGTPNATGTNSTCVTEIYIMKVPPQPPDDGINRTTYENVPVTIGAGSNGATHARVKYGYQEEGPVNDFYCTQYKQTCYYSDQNLPLNGTENLAIGVPQRVIFYQVEYLDGSDKVVATGPVTAHAIP